MDIEPFLESLAREGESLLAAAVRAGWDAEVPGCPDWRVRDLVIHQGTVHRWAGGIVADRRTAPVRAREEGVPDDLLPDWFTEGHRLLLKTLRDAPDDLECWTFLPGAPSARAFWTRRQAHETTIHRVDAESAAGTPLSPVAPDFAVDGIDELLAGFHVRPTSRVRSDRPRVLRVETPGAAPWTLRLSPEPPEVRRDGGGPADCVVSGPADALYLFLWNRWSGGDGIRVEGDADLADLWRVASAVRWSD